MENSTSKSAKFFETYFENIQRITAIGFTIINFLNSTIIDFYYESFSYKGFLLAIMSLAIFYFIFSKKMNNKDFIIYNSMFISVYIVLLVWYGYIGSIVSISTPLKWSIISIAITLLSTAIFLFFYKFLKQIQEQ